MPLALLASRKKKKEGESTNTKSLKSSSTMMSMGRMLSTKTGDGSPVRAASSPIRSSFPVPAMLQSQRTKQSSLDSDSRQGSTGMFNRPVSEWAQSPGQEVMSEALSSMPTRIRVSYHSATSSVHVADDSISSTCSQRIARSVLFTAFVNCMIGLNLVQMGIAIDRPDGKWQTIWLVCDNIFTFVFFAEAVIKLLASRYDYFYDRWNLFDFAIVIISVVDTWILSMVMNIKGTKSGLLRMFRMLRLVRMVKIFRMIPELMMVIYGIMHSMRSLFWVFGLLTLILYVFGIICVQVIGGDDAGYPGYDANEGLIKDSYQHWNNHLHFGTLTRAFVSLINMVLLAEWPTIVWPVWEHQGAVVLIFVVLVVFTTFGVMNVIIGVIVEKTNEAMESMKQETEDANKAMRMATVSNLAQMIAALDEDGSGDLSEDEMIRAGEHPELIQFLSQIDFPKGLTYIDLHRMLDKDSDGVVSQDEFTDAMFRLVHGTDFQHQCMLHVFFGEVKVMLKEVLMNQATIIDSQKMINLDQRIREAIKEESAKACADTSLMPDILSQLKPMQEQISLMVEMLGTTSRMQPVPAPEPEPFIRTVYVGVEPGASVEAVVEAKEEKMPAVSTSMPSFMESVVFGCQPITKEGTKLMLHEVVSKEVSASSNDMRKEIRALREAMTYPHRRVEPLNRGAVGASGSTLSTEVVTESLMVRGPPMAGAPQSPSIRRFDTPHAQQTAAGEQPMEQSPSLRRLDTPHPQQTATGERRMAGTDTLRAAGVEEGV